MNGELNKIRKKPVMAQSKNYPDFARVANDDYIKFESQ